MDWPWGVSDFAFADMRCEWLEEAPGQLRAVAENVTAAGERVVSLWDSRFCRPDVYSGPGDGGLYAAMRPVGRQCDELAEDLVAASRVLDEFYEEARRVQRDMAYFREASADLRAEAERRIRLLPIAVEPPQTLYVDVDGMPTRWDDEDDYYRFAKLCQATCDDIRASLSRWWQAVDGCVAALTRIRYEQWYDPDGSGSQVRPSGPPAEQMGLVEAAYDAQYVRQAVSHGSLSALDTARIQAILDRLGAAPPVLSRFYQDVGGVGTVMLLVELGAVPAGDSSWRRGGPPPTPAQRMLADEVRSGLAAGSSVWDLRQAMRFATDMEAASAAGGPPMGAVCFLFSGYADPLSRMGESLAHAEVTVLDGIRREGEPFPWDAGPDPAGPVLGTLGKYPAAAASFWSGDRDQALAGDRVSYWMGRDYADGFTGLAASLAAAVSGYLASDPTSGQAAWLASAMSVDLGHNPVLTGHGDPGGPLSPAAQVDIAKALAPWGALLTRISQSAESVPGLLPAFGPDGNPYVRDPATGTILDVCPALDRDGLRTLVGRSASSPQGQQAWTAVIAAQMEREIAAVKARGRDPSSMAIVRSNYFSAAGYLAGAVASAEGMDAAARAHATRVMLDLAAKGVSFVASVGISAASLDPVAAAGAGMAADAAINAFAQQLGTDPQAAAHSAECASSSTLVSDAEHAWSRLCADAGLDLGGESTMSYADILTDIGDGYARGAGGNLQEVLEAC